MSGLRGDEHGYNPYTRGCRCDVCRKAKADYVRERRARARSKAQLVGSDDGYHFVPDITHGRFGYEEHGCRCPECRRAINAMQQRLKAQRRARQRRAS